jgi:hypothetical protein
VAEVGAFRGEGLIHKLLIVLLHLEFEVVESELRFDFGNADVLVLLDEVVHILQRIEILVGLDMFAVLVVSEGLDLVFIFRLYGLAAERHMLLGLIFNIDLVFKNQGLY